MKTQTKFEEFDIKAMVQSLQVDKSGLSEDGQLLPDYINKKAGKFSTDVKRFPRDIELEDSSHRIARALKMQQDGTALHAAAHNVADTPDLRGMIGPGEVVQSVLHTVGYEKFPGSGETLTGEGIVVLTDKNVYFHHFGQSAFASGSEAAFGSTMCPRGCCMGIRGCCACVSSCKMMWGSYTHVAQRETRTALMCVSIEDQLLDTHTEEVLSTRLSRTFSFYPKARSGGCKSCKIWCCSVGTECFRLTAPCILNGFVIFDYDTGRNQKGALEQLIIKEKKEDTSFWGPFEVEELLTGVTRYGGPEKITQENWYQLISEHLPGRTVEQCMKKHKALVNGWHETQSSRVASYRALYIPFRDAGTRRIREAVCIIDPEKCKTQEVYKFVLAAQKIRNHCSAMSAKMQKEQVNSMEETGYPSRSLRDKVMMKGGLNILGSLGCLKFW